jgi:hypothetical protein
MKWNPQTLRWEGNEQVLRDFDAVVTSTRPGTTAELPVMYTTFGYNDSDLSNHSDSQQQNSDANFITIPLQLDPYSNVSIVNGDQHQTTNNDNRYISGSYNVNNIDNRIFNNPSTTNQYIHVQTGMLFYLHYTDTG